MPKFEVTTVEEATTKTARDKRARITNEYLGFIEQLAEGQAGKLTPSEGETVGAVRRRIGAAAKLAEEALEIRRIGDEVYFWIREGIGRGRGRPRKARVGES